MTYGIRDYFSRLVNNILFSKSYFFKVYPNFGPLGVTNPKAVVSQRAKQLMNTSTFVAYPIGKIDWTKVAEKPTLLNYSSTVKAASSARLSTDWYEECWENLIGQVS